RYGSCLKALPDQLLDTPLARLSALEITRAERQLLEIRAPGTVYLTHTVLRMALAQAVRWRLLPLNPCDGVDAPRVPRRTLVTWTSAEVRTFLTETYDQPEFPLWRLLLDSGMRIGEAQTLRWSDVDLDAQTVRIARTMTIGKDGRDMIGDDAKTGAGQRTIDI